MVDYKNKIQEIRTNIQNCHLCELHKTRDITVPGEGPISSTIMFIGEAPGKINNEVGLPFVGHGGKIFDKILSLCGIERKSIFITNILKCWPPENKKPKTKEIQYCKKYLFDQIEVIKPKIIFALGTTAYETLTNKKIKIKKEHGIPIIINNIKIVPIFHPNGIRYIKGGIKTIVEDIVKNI
ncbi:MAG: uracil-DNA glycosylase [Nanoarchaeota archaeon]|jgi:uracil-DNA glycosylase family 4|nr:uracil-DNA glycosylase [Nanoarchaeota archaeon]